MVDSVALIEEVYCTKLIKNLFSLHNILLDFFEVFKVQQVGVWPDLVQLHDKYCEF